MRHWNDKSIKIQLLGWLLTPLCVLGIVSSTIAYFLAAGFANDAYDRQLLNSADSVAARLKSKGDKIWVDLPAAAQAILKHNAPDKFYYQVLDKSGMRISGDAFFPGPYPKPQSKVPVYRYATLNGDEVRIVRISVSFSKDDTESDASNVQVQVAETLKGRQQLTTQILLSIVLPQLMLIVLGAFAVCWGVKRGLAPLAALEKALFRRSQYDLTLLEESAAPTEVRPLVSAINTLLQRLRNDIELQHRFVANAAHQFRTPLAALKTYVYAAKRLPADRTMHELLDSIDTGTNRMSHLADKLLSLARAEPSNQKFICVDLNDVASDVTASFVSEALTKKLELSFVGWDSPALVTGDPNNLKELTSNLIENAILYTPEGGNIEVRVDCTHLPSLVVLDDGPGIPLEERERVFERFYRILGSDVPGSGLGLSIVKEIVLAHGGRVSVESGANGRGALVKVGFPGLENV